MEKEDMKLQCVRLAMDIIGPHPSTTYVKANKHNFAEDVREEAKNIFEWVSGVEKPDTKIIPSNLSEAGNPPASGVLSGEGKPTPMVSAKGPHGKP